MRSINKIIMTLAGLLLIAAAVLKFHEMIDTCVPSWRDNPTGFWESYSFLLIQIPLEFALGVWMVSGLFRKAAWIAGTLAFFGFIFVTLTKWLTGAASCGCFGQIHVDPKITLFTMDIPFFLLLAVFRPKGAKLLPPPWPNLAYLLAIFVPTIALMVAAPSAMVALRPDCIKVEAKPDETAPLKLQIYKLNQQLQKQTQSAESFRQQVSSQNKTIEQLRQQIQSLTEQLQTLKNQQQTNHQAPPEPNIVEPIPDHAQPKVVTTEPNQTASPEANALPAAKQWDWLQYVVEDDVRKQLTEGLVIVLMHHYDCDVCAVMAPKYSDYYQQMVDNGTEDFKIAFLAIPPYGEADHVPDDTLCIQGKLTDKRKWQLMSPYVVALLNGELLKTWDPGTAPEPEKILDEVFE